MDIKLAILMVATLSGSCHSSIYSDSTGRIGNIELEPPKSYAAPSLPSPDQRKDVVRISHSQKSKSSPLDYVYTWRSEGSDAATAEVESKLTAGSNLVASGSYKLLSPDSIFSTIYVADENGYRAQFSINSQ